MEVNKLNFQYGDLSEDSKRNIGNPYSKIEHLTETIEDEKETLKVYVEALKNARSDVRKIIKDGQNSSNATQIMERKERLNQLRKDFSEQEILIEDLERQLEKLTITESSDKKSLEKKKNTISEKIYESNKNLGNTLDYNTSDNILLLTNQDSRGKYYDVLTQRGKNVKFYYEDPSAKLNEKLNDLTNFPKWCDDLSSFCNLWNLDNIAKKEELTKEEEVILRKVIQHSLGTKLYSFGRAGSTASEVFYELEKATRKKYPREVKDRMWKRIIVDKFCSNTTEVNAIFDNIILLEIYTWDAKYDSPLTNSVINNKIYKCLHRDLQDKLMTYAIALDELLEDSPRRLITKIVDLIDFLKRQSNAYDDNERKCSSCGSLVHANWNCPQKLDKNDLRPTQTYQREQNSIDS